LYKTIIESPIGFLEINCDENSLCSLEYHDEKPEIPENPNAICKEVQKQLQAYFKKELTEFNLPLDPKGTKFQKSVWNKVEEIRFGQTKTYFEIADSLNNHGAVRAVGLANGKNPIPIIIPCHRVIGANGKLTGYSGGLTKKAWLLEHEGALNPLFHQS
jgi:methylated-DNA-[protein]-cysteine S-methyltransferase